MEVISCQAVKTDVFCVKIYKNVVFIGCGHYLYIYCKNLKLIKKHIHIFNEHIYGIDIYNNEILIYGGIYLKKFNFNLTSLEFKLVASHIHSDWILMTKFVNQGTHITGVTMHNVAILWDSSFKVVEEKECSERCISYCGYLVNDDWNDLIVLSGTVFNQVLLWWPAKSSNRLCSVIHKLIGHKGVIFSIDYNPKSNIICTTSDDRTAKIWLVQGSDLCKELGENSIMINVKHTLIGHVARVFKCKILDDLVITAGEDGTVNIWSFQGELIRKIDVHQGGCVWSLDCSEATNEIVTGGGDSGVTLFKLHCSMSKVQVEVCKGENPKRIVISGDSLIYLTDNGVLVRYDLKNRLPTHTFTHDDLKSYGLLEKSPCGSAVALAGYHGNLHFYKSEIEGLTYTFSCKIKSEERIFSLHWLSCKSLITCGANGLLTAWVLDETNVRPIHFWQLPYSKERWSTAACLCGNSKVLVGDRRGTLYLYSFECGRPLQIIKKAHNYLGISNLYYRDGKITSLGRNSTLNQYEFDLETNRIIQISSHKVPFTWLASFHQNQSNNTALLIGFSGTNLIVYDHIARRTLLESDCGGGHRSWDSHIKANHFLFSYIKDKCINLIGCHLSDIQAVHLIKGYHLNEINALKIIRCDNKTRKCVFVSGGEDTVMRLCSKNLANDLNDFEHLSILKSHLSSIRTIEVIKFDDFQGKSRFLMFSGGGRSQIILWELTVSKTDENVISCREKFNFYEALGNGNDLETRVMSMSAFVTRNTIFLLAAYSDGSVKIFRVNSGDNLSLTCIQHMILYKSKCILKISTLSIDIHVILITMATDGVILFSDITDVFTDGKSAGNILISIKAHQSGINSFSSLQLDDQKFVFLTGGDDTSIALTAVKVSSGILRVDHFASFSDESYHGAQITGAFVTENYFLTASIDQKVLLFKWDLSGSAFSVECLREYSSSICDIQGMECMLEDSLVKVFLYGKGCEILSVKLLNNTIDYFENK